uniref:Uncharacterized protein n=1 Tax=Mycobacterium celatum TaxID=28045 RepID=Q93S62_MYCCE|nr:unknown [Mycobacterium celatum]
MQHRSKTASTAAAPQPGSQLPRQVCRRCPPSRCPLGHSRPRADPRPTSRSSAADYSCGDSPTIFGTPPAPPRPEPAPDPGVDETIDAGGVTFVAPYTGRTAQRRFVRLRMFARLCGPAITGRAPFGRLRRPLLAIIRFLCRVSRRAPASIFLAPGAAPRGGSPIIDSLVYRFCLHRAAGAFRP